MHLHTHASYTLHPDRASIEIVHSSCLYFRLDHRVRQRDKLIEVGFFCMSKTAFFLKSAICGTIKGILPKSSPNGRLPSLEHHRPKNLDHLEYHPSYRLKCRLGPIISKCIFKSCKNSIKLHFPLHLIGTPSLSFDSSSSSPSLPSSSPHCGEKS